MGVLSVFAPSSLGGANTDRIYPDYVTLVRYSVARVTSNCVIENVAHLLSLFVPQCGSFVVTICTAMWLICRHYFYCDVRMRDEVKEHVCKDENF